ncbi:MAG: hypothetical protein DCF16_12785, partial [Alphaproteobacteria bacterium]
MRRKRAALLCRSLWRFVRVRADYGFMDVNHDPAGAARALLAFWRAAGVDMDEAEAVYAGAPKAQAGTTARAPLPGREPA